MSETLDQNAVLAALIKLVQNISRGERLLRLPEVTERTGMDASTIYRGIEDRIFPLPRRASTRIIGWLESDLDAWLRNLPTTAQAPISPMPRSTGRPKE